jgi:SRSO17 transposase
VYGGAALRRLIRSLGMGYVMAVRGNHTVTTSPGTTMTVTAAARLLRPRHWQRMRTGSGSKGARDYYWAIMQVKPDDTPPGQAGEHDDGHSCLLLRRHRYTGTISYFRCWSPTSVPLPGLIEVAVRRWRIEEDHQLSKQVTGLDSGQVRTWTSWHRWTALCLTAYAFLAVTTALLHTTSTPSSSQEQLIPITIPELLRLIRGTVIPAPRRDRTHRNDRACGREIRGAGGPCRRSRSRRAARASVRRSPGH